jgi:hypothetical protein
MKKIFYIATALLLLCLFYGCNKSVDYNSYVSEYRKGVYIYEDDDLTLKIYFSEREVPYVSDGIKGKMENLCEVFLSYSPTPSSAEIYFSLTDEQTGNVEWGGEMNYQAVTKSFYLSFSCGYTGQENINATLTIDGKERKIDVNNVLYDGVIDEATALKCVVEYDGSKFASLTKGSLFNGEIYIRLLYDQGCYYYVGIIDKKGNTYAYLVDGESGRIIATRTSG